MCEVVSNSAFEISVIAESLCKSGRHREGIQLFLQALQIGTDDIFLLDAIYNTLGNAYFYAEEYEKALQYNKYCLSLAKLTNNKASESRACGNLGNTLKLLKRFDEAFVCGNQHLTISLDLQDRVSEGRAYFNIGCLFYTMANEQIKSANYEKGISDDARFLLEQALTFYKSSLIVSNELNLKSSQARILGNMGSANYLLGNYKESLYYHEQRLNLATTENDLESQLRCFSNLANCFLFLNDIKMASEYYLKAYLLSKDLNNISSQLSSVFNLANAYLMLNDAYKSVEYFTLHLRLTEENGGCSNANVMHSLYNLALIFNASGLNLKTEECIERLQKMAKQLKDDFYLSKVRQLISDLNIKENATLSKTRAELVNRDTQAKILSSVTSFSTIKSHNSTLSCTTNSFSCNGSAKTSLGPFVEKGPHIFVQNISPQLIAQNMYGKQYETRQMQNKYVEEPDLMEMIASMQSHRLDDQRCSQRLLFSSPSQALANVSTNRMIQTDHTSNDLLSVRSATNGHLPGLVTNKKLGQTIYVSAEETFLELIVKRQFSRIESQRSHPPNLSVKTEEDFFTLLTRVQSTRLENQRYPFTIPTSQNLLPPLKKSPSKSPRGPSRISIDSGSARSTTSGHSGSEKIAGKKSYLKRNIVQVFRRQRSKSVSKVA